ncbi:MAG TPA: hypothetical protein VGQ64_01860 [Candidatus Limnocylindrales bacterium]|jgi:hypothetical protein|nr:hypothetical protein [Candidatus Limnocylindrales bacterium]
MSSKLRDVATARDRLARPYGPEHDASIRRKAAKPRDLLGWFLRGFRAELPEQIHASGVWADAKRRGDVGDYAPVGGSLIGTPRSADPFRAYLEGDPLEETELARLTEAGVVIADTAYRFPMRAALAALAGRGADHDPYPFMARMLFRTASMNGDWNAAGRSMGIIEPVRWPYLVAALERLYDRYLDEPPARFYANRTEALALSL